MFLFIAGVQPKTRTLDSTPRRCPRCGLHQAYPQQVDHYFSLFFIPLVRVKTGEMFLYCRRCRQAVDSAAGAAQTRPESDRQTPICRHCGRSIRKEFRYCPYCGRHQ
ncbi:MAG: zinc ribbon domain-containing protein [Desulfobacteraceae bacterium]|jgi:uncharacterized CHY-type Zn-finger protein